MSKILQFPQAQGTSSREPPSAGAPEPPVSLAERIESDRAVLEQAMTAISTMPMPTDTRAQLLARAADLANTAADLARRAKAAPMPVAAPGVAADLSRLEDGMQTLLDEYHALLPSSPTAVSSPTLLRGLSGSAASGSGLAWGIVIAGALAIGTGVWALLRRS